MVSFEEFVLHDDSPIYIQIIQYVKQGIVSGAISNNDSMPSRRMMSALLGVNPNTIQKAYQILEKEGLLLSQTGAKSTITIEEDVVVSLRKELVQSNIQSMIVAMNSMGIKKEEAQRYLDELWEETV